MDHSLINEEDERLWDGASIVELSLLTVEHVFSHFFVDVYRTASPSKS
jgi:hypothetical protein